MIVVLGGRHDPVAAALVAAWVAAFANAQPGAALCSAEDLCAPGWVWPLAGDDAGRRWVVQGRAVADSAISGVFVARSAVHAAELHGTHPRDRAYLAAELTAFVAHLLASTAARVTAPVVDGAFGDATLRPERWMPLAAQCGLAPPPLRLQSAAPPLPPAWQAWPVDVVGPKCFGRGLDRLPARRREGAAQLVAALGLAWARLIFDGTSRLRLIGTVAVPDPRALTALGRALSGLAGQAA